MRRPIVALLSLALVACQPAPNRAEGKANDAAGAAAKPEPTKPESKPRVSPKPAEPEIVRKDLVAEELPAIPTLEQLTATELAAGEFTFPEGTNELVARAASSLGDGLLLVGQAYFDRRPGQPSPSWRWAGFAPSSGEPRSTRYDPGVIRAAIAHDGGGLLTGNRGVGFDARGWFAMVAPDGTIKTETPLDSPNSTEMFDLIPGRGDGELTVVAGYVDAQGWLVSLDASGNRRWEKYIGSYGYTQIRALARLDDGDLLAVGSRGQKFAEFWAAVAPGDGGETAAPDDVTQTKIEIAGADQNQMLRALVDLGEGGYVALGTAKRNYLQAHDQLVAVGFDRSGKLGWSRVIAELRVTDVLGARVHDGAAQFLVAVPTSNDPRPPTALALVSVPVDASAPVVARQLSDTEGWTSAGFIEGSATDFVAQRPSDAGLEWRRLAEDGKTRSQ